MDVNSLKVSVADYTKKLRECIDYKPKLDAAKTTIQGMFNDLTAIDGLFQQGYKLPNEAGYFCGASLKEILEKIKSIESNIDACLRQLCTDAGLVKRDLDNALYRLALAVGQYNKGIDEDSITPKINYSSLQVVKDANTCISQYNNLTWNIGGYTHE